MENKSIVESLHDKGLSYTIMARITGVHVSDVKKAKITQAILSRDAVARLSLLDFSLSYALGQQWEVDPVAIFEEHIIVGKVDGRPRWAKVCDLWIKERISHVELEKILLGTSKLYSYEDLTTNYPLEYEVVAAGDGFPSMLAKLPIDAATPEELERFKM